MMLDLCSKLVDNDLTKEELLQNVEIDKMSFDDAPFITDIFHRSFGLPSIEEALRQLIFTNARLDESVKLIDRRNGDIYGFLIFSEHPIQVGSPIGMINPYLSAFLGGMKQIHGFAFAIDERLRGVGLDRKMLLYNMEFLKGFTYIWCAVEKDLKSHNYWQRLGFKEIFSIPDAKFYMLPLNKSISPYIYNMVDFLKDGNYKDNRTSGTIDS